MPPLSPSARGRVAGELPRGKPGRRRCFLCAGRWVPAINPEQEARYHRHRFHADLWRAA